MVCHAVSRFDRRLDSLRRIGGPFLLPLSSISMLPSGGVF